MWQFSGSFQYKFYYDGADISLSTMEINIEEDEEESVLIYDEEEMWLSGTYLGATFF